MKSLFLRMRLVHWIGVVLLLVNATFFTDNLIGAVIQYVVALVILVHDLDEKRWGVDTAQAARSRSTSRTSVPVTSHERRVSTPRSIVRYTTC